MTDSFTEYLDLLETPKDVNEDEIKRVLSVLDSDDDIGSRLIGNELNKETFQLLMIKSNLDKPTMKKHYNDASLYSQIKDDCLDAAPTKMEFEQWSDIHKNAYLEKTYGIT